MLVRKMCLAMLALAVCCPTFARADDTIPLNEEYKGKTKAGKGRNAPTSDSVSINLKAGLHVELVARMTGDNRKAAIVVWNSDGDLIAASITGEFGRPLARKIGERDKANIFKAPVDMARLSIGAVPGTGKYTITVYSNIAGDYTLIARDPSKKRDIATIQKELEAAKNRVKELEKELMQAQRQILPK